MIPGRKLHRVFYELICGGQVYLARDWRKSGVSLRRALQAASRTTW